MGIWIGLAQIGADFGANIVVWKDGKAIWITVDARQKVGPSCALPCTKRWLAGARKLTACGFSLWHHLAERVSQKYPGTFQLPLSTQ